ncbi:hypothetical protein GQ53DRAFT_760030 [Thozetella sp. PMI_491]|nr:hypothetical protein GQ53DRAFT_760030 [Thozetella sp. PMI_491]
MQLDFCLRFRANANTGVVPPITRPGLPAQCPRFERGGERRGGVRRNGALSPRGRESRAARQSPTQEELLCGVFGWTQRAAGVTQKRDLDAAKGQKRVEGGGDRMATKLAEPVGGECRGGSKVERRKCRGSARAYRFIEVPAKASKRGKLIHRVPRTGGAKRGPSILHSGSAVKSKIG